MTSFGERIFIEQGCQMNFRQDGRGNSDFRVFHLENSPLPHVHGSSRYKVLDSVDILCSVKLEVSSQLILKDLLDISIEMSPSCDKKLSKTTIDNTLQTSEHLKSFLLQSGAIDIKSLTIIPGKFYWSLQIDLLVMGMDGSLIDCSSLALFSALSSCRIPQLELFAGESGEIEDFEVSGDVSRAGWLQSNRVPLVLSVHRVGGALILDPCSAELACSQGGLVLALDREGGLCGAGKVFGGGLSPSEIIQAMQLARDASSSLFSSLRSACDPGQPLYLPTPSSSSLPLPADLPVPRQGLLA